MTDPYKAIPTENMTLSPKKEALLGVLAEVWATIRFVSAGCTTMVMIAGGVTIVISGFLWVCYSYIISVGYLLYWTSLAEILPVPNLDGYATGPTSWDYVAFATAIGVLLPTLLFGFPKRDPDTNPITYLKDIP
jgi:hypothetical protein